MTREPLSRTDAAEMLADSYRRAKDRVRFLKQELRVASSPNRRAELKADLLETQDSLDVIERCANRIGLALPQPTEPAWPWGMWTKR